MKKIAFTMFGVLALSLTAFAQGSFNNAAFSGGYNHITGYQGLNGFDVGAEMIVVKPVSLAFDYDGVWNNSTIGVFQVTSIGLTSVKTHDQNWLIGPRAYFPLLFKHKSDEKGPCGTSWGLRSIMPFAEVQFGESDISSTLTIVNSGSVSASDTAFVWSLGGGGDIRLNPHWAFRGKVDLLRTHFVNTGQSHARIVLGLVYTVKKRAKW